MQHIPGPDFPTAGIINGSQEIAAAYLTGRGRLYVRARTTIEEDDKGRQTIVITELNTQNACCGEPSSVPSGVRDASQDR